MRLIKFLSLLEKIIIILIILCFIPIAFFAYLPHPTFISSQLETSFQVVSKQAGLSGFLTDNAPGGQCGSRATLALMNELCLERCQMGNTCLMITSTQSCPYTYSYTINQTKICSINPVLNQVVPTDTPSFMVNQQWLPLATVEMASNQSLISNFYCINNLQQCRQLVSSFGHDLQSSFSDNYSTFSVVVQYLMYFGLLPLMVHTVVVLTLDCFCHFNLRLTNSLMIIHEALTGAGIIISGIAFYQQNSNLQDKVNSLASDCLIKATQCQSLVDPFANFIVDSGVSSTFVIIMCCVLALEVLLLIGVVVLNVLMVKYYKLRETDPSLSGYELQTL